MLTTGLLFAVLIFLNLLIVYKIRYLRIFPWLSVDLALFVMVIWTKRCKKLYPLFAVLVFEEYSKNVTPAYNEGRLLFWNVNCLCDRNIYKRGINYIFNNFNPFMHGICISILLQIELTIGKH
jgi:hypothetical protein